MCEIAIDPILRDALNSEIDIDNIKSLITRTSIVAWDHSITEADIDKWLSNFDGSACGDKDLEQKLACWILLHFTYFTEDDINSLCKSLLSKYIHTRIEEMKKSPLEYSGVTNHVDYIIKNTYFKPMGNPSESGGRILYNFRTANNLPKSCFEDNGYCENIVLLDDVTITGSQASEYIKSLSSSCKNLYFGTFFATQSAIDTLSKNGSIDLLYVSLLDERTKVFHDDSFVFSHVKMNGMKCLAQEICEFYGNKIVDNFTSQDMAYMKRFPLGFGNSQQLLGFVYNTPDNVLPILWGDTPEWNSIFKRTFKINTFEGSENNSEQYF